ncbi:MAG TPA: Gfo/Idh/MocA family oxidoreductase [Anseongella sp.]
MTFKNDRRRFLKQLGGASALVATGSVSNVACTTRREVLTSTAKTTSQEKVRIACIGMGIMGFGDLATAVKVPGIELIGVCDLYDGHLEHAREVYGQKIFTTRDYKQILDRKDVDAVIVAVPDHWHDHIAIDALQAGKHVYCEKPMVQHLDEGHAVIDAAKTSGKVFQVGSQRVSSVAFARAQELFRQGDIGDINVIEGFYDRHNALGAWQYSIPPDASPETVDWQRYVGDAPAHAYDAKRFFRWRNYRDYGTGVAGDLFVHLISGYHFITGAKGPKRIIATGDLSYWEDGRDVPDIMTAIMEYPKTDKHAAFQVQLRVNFADGSGGGQRTRIVGTEGVINLGWNDFVLKKHLLPEAPGYGGWDLYGTFPEDVKKSFVARYDKEYPPETRKVTQPEDIQFAAPEGYDDRYDHSVNFFEAIRTGKPVVEDAVFGLRAAGPALACNESYFNNRVVHWDAENMKETKG